jgi:hypothetical protein
MVYGASRDLEFLCRNRDSARVSDRRCEPVDLLSIHFLQEAVSRAAFPAALAISNPLTLPSSLWQYSFLLMLRFMM